jgi:hypothetical protein
MIHSKFGAYRTNHFEVIQFLLNFGVSSAAILDFEKMAALSHPVSRARQGEAPGQIWRKSDERFRSYSSFCKFPYGGQRPSWIVNFAI